MRLSRRLGAAVMSFVFGCAPTSPTSSSVGPRPVPPRAPTTPTPPPSVAPSANDPDPAPLVTEAPAIVVDPEQREVFRVLAPICEAIAGPDEDGELRVGCACCAPFSECPPKPGASPEATLVTALVRSAAFGSFTGAHKEEAALSMDGCEPHGGNYGGTVVAEKIDGSWTMTNYDGGNHPDRTRPYRMPDGRDLVVSQWADGHQTSSDILYTRDLTEPDLHFEPFFSVHDNTGMSCMNHEPGIWGVIDDWRFDDVDRNGALDLRVRARVGSSRYSGAYAAKCQQFMDAQRRGAPDVDVTGVMKKKKLDLVFTFDGKSFVPTAASLRLMKGI